jgi:hypothetical protein
MKKIELKQDTKIMGLGTIPAGTQFKVESFNSRYIYVKANRCTLRLTIKEVNVIC